MRLVKQKPDTAGTMLGILSTSTPLRALEISRSGCLLESSRQIAAGTAGRLRLEIDGRTYSEEVRVTRCQRLEGAGASYRLGVEFLRTRRPSSSSLRRAVYLILGAADCGAVAGETRLLLPTQDVEAELPKAELQRRSRV